MTLADYSPEHSSCCLASAAVHDSSAHLPLELWADDGQHWSYGPGRTTLSRGRKCGSKVVLHATGTGVQHSVTSQPAEAANGGGHMGDKNYVFGDDPEAVNWRQRNELCDVKFSVNSRMLYRWATGERRNTFVFILIQRSKWCHFNRWVHLGSNILIFRILFWWNQKSADWFSTI